MTSEYYYEIATSNNPNNPIDKFSCLLKGLQVEGLFDTGRKINQMLYQLITCTPDILKESIYSSSLIPSPKNNILGTMTTCKRFDLYRRTMKSIHDKLDSSNISEWFIVDDNSSSTERHLMLTEIPLNNPAFYFKAPHEKGHPQSLNIILKYAIEKKFQYIVHFEDDHEFIQWLFPTFKQSEFVKDSPVLQKNEYDII